MSNKSGLKKKFNRVIESSAFRKQKRDVIRSAAELQAELEVNYEHKIKLLQFRDKVSKALLLACLTVIIALSIAVSILITK